MAALSIVLTTVPTEEKGAEIARILVAEGRCACINLVPRVRSFYVWEGKAQDDGEALLVAKVPTRALDSYRDRMTQLHPYQVPEIVALDAAAVNVAYSAWCEQAVR